MLTREHNELVTRTGPGTPMGAMLRRYWIPFLLSEELPEPECPPVRVKLLSERLLVFRDSEGRLGLIDEFCAHRGVSLWFGRNEQSGIRCPYHGWKYDVTGQCVEVPSEPVESGFCNKIRLKSYPCVERGGIVWAYMGPPAEQPPVPAFEWANLPTSHCYITKRWQECNYLQAMEGGVDSSHVSFLHSSDLHTDPLHKNFLRSGPAHRARRSCPALQIRGADTPSPRHGERACESCRDARPSSRKCASRDRPASRSAAGCAARGCPRLPVRRRGPRAYWAAARAPRALRRKRPRCPSDCRAAGEKAFRHRAPANISCTNEEDAFHDSKPARCRLRKVKSNRIKSTRSPCNRPNCLLYSVEECSAIRLPSESTIMTRNPWGPIDCFSTSTLPPCERTAAAASSSRPSVER